MLPRNAGSERNKVFAYRVLDLVKRCHGRVFGVMFIKSTTSPVPSVSMYTHGLQILMERYNEFLSEYGTNGIVIIETRSAHTTRGRGADYQVANSYLSYVFGHKEGRQLKRLVEAPLFADSALTVGIQIADIVAALCYGTTYDRCFRGQAGIDGFGDYSHSSCFRKPLLEQAYLSKRKKRGYHLRGLRTIDHRKR